MAKLLNLARMTTATTGTSTITLGAAVSGYLTFAQAGAANGDIVDYAIKDGNNSEIGTGTYASSGTTLTRSVTKSTNSNAAINLSGTAEVFITPRAETLADASSLTSGVLDPARIGGRAILQSKLNLSGLSNPGVADLNNLRTAGFYANTGYLNTPEAAGTTGNYWFVIVQEWDNTSYTNQLAMPLTGGTNDVWVRSQQGGSWSAWKRLNDQGLRSQTFLSSGTFITPANTNSWTVFRYRIQGGGAGGSGGGGGLDATSGGGAGAYAEGTFSGIAAGTGITITVGGAGAGATAATGASGTGGAGGASALGSPVNVTCGGGIASSPGRANWATAVGGTVTGSPNILAVPGSMGRPPSFTNTSGVNNGGLGGDSVLGRGGAGGVSTIIAASLYAASGYGAGGGSAEAGGIASNSPGTQGIVIIEWSA